MNKLRIILQYDFVCLLIVISVIVFSLVRCNIIYSSKYNIDETELEGTLISKSFDGDKFSFIIKGKEKVKCSYYLSSLEEKEYYESLDLGVTLKLNGTLNEPSENTIPNNFNYKNYLRLNRINYTFSVKNIDVTSNNINVIYTLKNSIINRIKKYDNSDYLMMFIIGDKSTFDKNQYSVYSDLSVTHAFAISGLHISILSMLLLRIFKFLNDKKYILVIFILLVYMCLTSFSPSVVRSVVFFSMIYLNKRLNFNLELYNVFYLTISLILLIEPFFLFNVGFQYSSLISFVLIKYNKIINGNSITQLIKTSLLAFFVSLPISVNSNYEVNILGFINNLIFVPYISFLLYPLSLLTFVFKFLDGINYIFIYVLEFISNYLFVFKVVIPKLNILEIIIYYLFFYLFLNTYKKKYLLFILLLITIHKYSFIFDSNSYVYFFDVGQGDSSLIINNHKLYMIDTGGKETYYKETWMEREKYYYTDSIVKFIKSIGYEKIDTLILTHGDYDHMGEALNLVNSFMVEKVILNCGTFNDLEQELITNLNNKKISYYSCISNLDNLLFLQTKEFNNENDNSNVIFTELNGFKFLFMGDASVTTEKEIMNKYNLPNIDVLKVGHHGSKTSSGKEFISEINPKYSIIIVGKNNRYGHPNNEVLDNLKNSNIYRTDQDGSIMFMIKNNKLKIETCSP